MSQQTSKQILKSFAIKDTLKTISCVVIAVSAFAAFYFLPTQKQLWINWLAFFVLLMLAIGIFLKYTVMGQELFVFFKEAVTQGRKIVWPSRKEVGKITLAVFIFALLMSLFVFGTDHGLQWLIYSVFLGWK